MGRKAEGPQGRKDRKAVAPPLTTARGGATGIEEDTGLGRG